MALPEDINLNADERLLKQILLNLLSNAVKFTPEGGRVRVIGEWSEKGVALSVCDSGIGIPADKLAHVIEPFVQVETVYSRKYGGTGLGLPISKKFAELHGGTLVIDSVLGEGTTATVHLPGDRIVAQRDRDTIDSARAFLHAAPSCCSSTARTGSMGSRNGL